MPNDLRVRVATLVSTMPPAESPVTDQQMENTILDYCEAKGISVSGSKQVILNSFTDALWNDVRKIARDHRRRKKQLAQASSLQGELDAELGV